MREKKRKGGEERVYKRMTERENEGVRKNKRDDGIETKNMSKLCHLRSFCIEIGMETR